jgi:hypothetical protein
LEKLLIRNIRWNTFLRDFDAYDKDNSESVTGKELKSKLSV